MCLTRWLVTLSGYFLRLLPLSGYSLSQSWSVLTPFYSEDILYSKAGLLKKAAFMDVHTLLYLQTLHADEWSNFLERMKLKGSNNNNNSSSSSSSHIDLWSDPHVHQEVCIWASLRGQTLFRTVQGMMYYEAALRLLAKVEGLTERGGWGGGLAHWHSIHLCRHTLSF